MINIEEFRENVLPKYLEEADKIHKEYLTTPKIKRRVWNKATKRIEIIYK